MMKERSGMCEWFGDVEKMEEDGIAKKVYERYERYER